MGPKPSRPEMEPLDEPAAEALAAGLPDHPFTLGARSLLQRGLGEAWLRGHSADPSAAVVVAPWLPAEPMAFGSDPGEIVSLLREIPGWDCVNVSSEVAERLAPLLERELRTPTRIYGDVHFVLSHGPVHFEHPWVRRLGEDDLSRIEEAPPAVRPGGVPTPLVALAGGVSAGGLLDGKLVSVVSMTAYSEKFADLRAHTLEPWRNQGRGSAAASAGASELVDRGWTPVWSTGEDNLPSQRLARKLGFEEFGRKAYVVVPALQASGGFRPGHDPSTL